MLFWWITFILVGEMPTSPHVVLKLWNDRRLDNLLSGWANTFLLSLESFLGWLLFTLTWLQFLGAFPISAEEFEYFSVSSGLWGWRNSHEACLLVYQLPETFIQPSKVAGLQRSPFGNTSRWEETTQECFGIPYNEWIRRGLWANGWNKVTLRVSVCMHDYGVGCSICSPPLACWDENEPHETLNRLKKRRKENWTDLL